MQRSTRMSVVVMAAITALIAAGCSSDDSSSDAPATAATTAAPATSSTAATTAAAATIASSAPTGSSSPGPAAASADDVSPTTAAPKPPASLKMGGTLKISTDGEAACYVPSLCTVSYGPATVRGGVLQNLAQAATNPQGYVLVLADSITPNADFTTFTVKLKPGIVYSDGTPFTAGDVKTLFETYVLADKSSIKGNLPPITSVEAPDDSTVVFTLGTPVAPFPLLLTLVPIWKPTPGLTQTSLPVGTGPFMFDSWQPNQLTKLVRNPHYAGKDAAGNQLPYLDEVDATPVASGDTRANALQSGQTDLAMTVDPLEAQNLASIGTTKSSQLNSGGGIFFNTQKPPVDDVRVRQALADATNKGDILQAIGGGDPRQEYWVPGSPWYSADAAKATPTFDLAKAKDLLDQYIKDPKRSDGQPAGSPVAVEIKVLQGSVTQESIADLAQQQWGEAGVKVTVTQEDQATLIGDASAGNYQTDYFQWGTPSPYGLLTHNYGPSASTPTNFTHFDDADLTAIIAKLAVAKTTSESNDLVHQTNMIFAKQVPVLFLHSVTVTWGSSKKVNDVPLVAANGYADLGLVSLAG
jgi:peptide/nickel transport system substrate-binding protein